MKHRAELDAALSAMVSADLAANVRLLLLDYLEWLLETNQTINLTAITDVREALRLHLVDSLEALPEIDAAPQGRMLDIGTGGGLPGLPLALASGRPATLLDSVRKKAVALQGFVDAAGLEIVTAPQRAEEHALEHPGAYSVVVARAVAGLDALAELASPLLAPHGHLVCLKGRLSQGELDRGDRAAEVVGLGRLSIRRFVLPGGDEERVIVVYVKDGASHIDLPRRIGMAQKKPLG